jgi:hypothetical protein
MTQNELTDPSTLKTPPTATDTTGTTGTTDDSSAGADEPMSQADKAAEQKLSSTVEQHLTRLIGDLEKLKSRKMKAAILVRVLNTLKDSGVKQQVVKQLMQQTYA